MSLATFIADQRTSHHLPHAVACRALAVSESWFYKWHHRPRQPTPSGLRRAELDVAVAARGGKDQVAGVVFHSDRGSTYTATSLTALCKNLDIRQSMGHVGSCFDNAAAESFFSTLEHEVLSRHYFKPAKKHGRPL